MLVLLNCLEHIWLWKQWAINSTFCVSINQYFVMLCDAKHFHGDWWSEVWSSFSAFVNEFRRTNDCAPANGPVTRKSGHYCLRNTNTYLLYLIHLGMPKYRFCSISVQLIILAFLWTIIHHPLVEVRLKCVEFLRHIIFSTYKFINICFMSNPSVDVTCRFIQVTRDHIDIFVNYTKVYNREYHGHT